MTVQSSSEIQSVLIVDDEAHVLTALRRTLHGEPYRVFTAAGAGEALEHLSNNDIAVIISDYRMPDMDGVTFLQQAKDILPDTVRIILSGFADISAVIDAVNKGEIFKFISKPWNDNELKLTIAQSLEHWTLKKHNRELAKELQDANQELRRLNEHLEGEVNRRSRELFLKDKRFLLSQYINEHVPVALLGIDENDMIALANRKASAILSTDRSVVGSGYQQVFTAELTTTIAGLRREGTNAKVDVSIGEKTYKLLFLPLRLQGTAGSDLITLIECETLRPPRIDLSQDVDRDEYLTG